MLRTAIYTTALLCAILPCEYLSADEFPQPVIQEDWWPIAGNPDLGAISSPKQQPVDFAVWQAADGTWQLWSCIRKTTCGGKTRVFYRWEGKSPTATNWEPQGIAMQADPEVGETEGGLQAPHVVLVGKTYHMFYGDWNNICHATSEDGKNFQRVVQPNGKTGMFSEGKEGFARDVMLLPVANGWHGYYTANPSVTPSISQKNRQGAVYLRKTRDFKTWTDSVVVAFGGLTDTTAYSAECPFVFERDGHYYLLRTQKYGKDQISTLYHSDDPNYFGINQDERFLVARMPVAAPEIVLHNGEYYVFALNPELNGIRATKLTWE
ncbi:hypothetical protein M4951_04800 [Blastopirellula sp. J2-11]|uniref:hypothetical protein n=1 Tax=Blastopirellula sp. J2-11 TaxID=2943192 RepID=UPI0021C6DF8D|nr:hypothetical protein [Blastopirellula sp. J2-11]UUO07627.1 hypothetical protein M4951_04800 [Blastopirellula sp. J2-11]